MNRARAALCGLALALGAVGAAADDDPWLALFSRCTGSMSETAKALWTEFPDARRGFAAEAAMLAIQELDADAAGYLESWSRFRPRSVVVSEMCAMADVQAAMLEALKRGDKAALDELQERFDGLLLEMTEAEEERQRTLYRMFGIDR